MMQLYCIVLYMPPVLNPVSYDGARVLEASGRPMLVIGRSSNQKTKMIAQQVQMECNR